ncbi:MAG: hypothetical protein RB191_10935 [Terriglobia bacterium]|nr:hypothetical protein [Terriglobia bacterium]
MITITDRTYAQVMKALDSGDHAERQRAMKQLRLEAFDAAIAELEFNNEAPALCRRQV